MTILCAGCSWTYGLGLEADETYPAYLQKYTKETVINAGSAGVDIPYTLWSVYKLLKDITPSIVILQLTTLDRLTISVDGKQNFLKQIHYDTKRDTQVYYDGNKFARISSIGSFNREHITVGSYTDSLKGKTNKDTVIKSLFENTIYDNYTTDQIVMQLEYFSAYLESKNIKLVMFPWLRKFGAESFIDHLSYHKTSVQEFLQNNNRETYIDNGFHTGPQENKFIAEEYVFPLIKDLTTNRNESIL